MLPPRPVDTVGAVRSDWPSRPRDRRKAVEAHAPFGCCRSPPQLAQSSARGPAAQTMKNKQRIRARLRPGRPCAGRAARSRRCLPSRSRSRRRARRPTTTPGPTRSRSRRSGSDTGDDGRGDDRGRASRASRRRCWRQRQHEPDDLVEVDGAVDGQVHLRRHEPRHEPDDRRLHRRERRRAHRGRVERRRPITTPGSRAASFLDADERDRPTTIQVGVRPSGALGRVHAHLERERGRERRLRRTRSRSAADDGSRPGWNVGATVQPPAEPGTTSCCIGHTVWYAYTPTSGGSCGPHARHRLPVRAQRLHAARRSPGSRIVGRAGQDRRRRPARPTTSRSARATAARARSCCDWALDATPINDDFASADDLYGGGEHRRDARSPRASSPASRRRSPGMPA